MLRNYYLFGYIAVACLVSAFAFAQAPADGEIIANQNRRTAGILTNGLLNVQLELRSGTWHPEANDGPQLFVQTFGEVGQAAQIPGPLLRMPEGTTVHATVANKLKMKATVYGLNTRPGDAEMGVEIPPVKAMSSTLLPARRGLITTGRGRRSLSRLSSVRWCSRCEQMRISTVPSLWILPVPSFPTAYS